MPSNDSSPPASLFTFTLADSSGKDISDNITVLHHHRTLPSPTTRKRVLSRIISQCPPGYIFNYSYCDRNISPQASARYCREPSASTHSFFRGSCQVNEFCVDTANRFVYDDTAFCISTHDFVVLARDVIKGPIGAGAAQLGVPSTGSHVYAVEAILTGKDPTRSVFAKSVSIQCRKYGIFNGRPAWLPVDGDGGRSHCSNCASTGVGKVPDGTESFDVSVILGAGSEIGKGNEGVVLWLTSFQP